MVLKAHICGSGGEPEGPGGPWADEGGISNKSGLDMLLSFLEAFINHSQTVC